MTKFDGSEPVRDMAKSVISDPPSSVEGLDLAPPAQPREVTEAMVELAAREMHTINVEEANADRKAHGLALPEKWADPFESPSMARQLAKLKREATRIVTAALNAPARTASDLNIERQVAGLDDIDRDDAVKWRAVSEECEKAGCCLLNAPARGEALMVDENAWKPIATVPKDRLVDLWWEGLRFCDCYYDHICDEWRTSRPGNRLFCGIKKPTHWMDAPKSPLPAIEAARERGDG